MKAGLYNITIKQGKHFRVVLTWRDSVNALINLTGYTAVLQARKNVDSPVTLINLTVGSGITLGGTLGTITLNIDSTTTATYTFTNAVYELELTPPNAEKLGLIEGLITVSKEVVR